MAGRYPHGILGVGAAATAGGALTAAVPLPFALAAALQPDFADPNRLGWSWPTMRVAAAALASMLLLSAGLALLRGRALGRRRTAAALLSAALAALPGLVSEPASTLAAFVAAAALFTVLGRATSPGFAPDRPAPSASAARTSGALGMAAVAWFLAAWHRATATPTRLGILLCSGVALAFALIWLVERSDPSAEGRPARWRLWVAWTGALGLAAAALVQRSGELGGAGVIVLASAVPRFVLTAPAPVTREDQGDWARALVDHPARLLVATFVGLGVLGAALLALPASSSGAPLQPIDAAFTAVSATCVTGLVVVDTPHAFSFLGQLGVLLLIQVGGLGIMTFSTAALALLGRRPSIRHEGAVSELVGARGRADVFGAVRRVLWFTFTAELLGALVLCGAFVGAGDTLAYAVWRAVFTSISAFCNAGFALQSDSLVGYQRHALVLDTVALLIIVGGLGPLIVTMVPRVVRRRPTTAYVRLALATTLALLAGSTACIALFEWRATLASLPLVDKLHNAFFQAATLRTAGFNSVDTAALVPATRLIMVVLMFVGGCPGSTAGGIKTTTAAVLVLAVAAALRRRDQVRIFGRRIAHASVYRAAAVTTLAMATAVLALVGLLLTQRLDLGAAIFEVFSALGTVGLSLGATARVDAVGKLILIGCMLAGRVGPLTFFMLLSDRRPGPALRLPAEEISVG